MLVALIGNGAETMLNFRASLIRHLASRGHAVAAFAPNYGPESRKAVHRLGATPHDFPLDRSSTNPLSDLWTLAALRRHLARLRPDACLCYFVKPSIYGNLAAALVGVPRRIVMLEGLGYSFADDGNQSLRQRLVSCLVRLLLKISLSRAQIILVLNEDDRVTLVERTGMNPDRVINIGGIGVDIEDFDPVVVAENPTTFLMAARLIAEKGVVQFVEAASRIRAQDDRIRFILLGDVDDNPHSLTREQIAAWHDAGTIEWLGHVENVQDYMKQADVFVLPSYYREGVPRSTQEAMALGRAIITTDHVGCRDTVDDGVNGFLVPVKDVDALVLAMRRLIDTPGLARRMGRESRALAESRFNAANVNARIADMLES